MTVRDMIKEAYVLDALDEFINEGVGSRQTKLTDVIASAFEEPKGGFRKATVCFAYGRPKRPEVICIPRDRLLKAYRPSCPDDMERLKVAPSPEERRFLMNKMARKLLLAHHDLFRGWTPDRESFLSAEVAEPLRADRFSFVKAVVCTIADEPLVCPLNEDDISFRLVDLLKETVSKENALSKAYHYFAEKSKVSASEMAKKVKNDFFFRGAVPPFVIRGEKKALKDLLEDLVIGSEIKGMRTAVFEGDDLERMTADQAFALDGYWIFVNVSSGLSEKAEERLMHLTAMGDRIAILTRDELEFAREDLKIMYKDSNRYQLEEV